MSFTQLERIKKLDQTPADAIASYGSFVEYMNSLKTRIAKRKTKRWTPERISYSKGLNALPVFHEVIMSKFGRDVMHQAINTHPFK